MAKSLGLERTVFLGPKGQGLEGWKFCGFDLDGFWSNLNRDLTHGSLKKNNKAVNRKGNP